LDAGINIFVNGISGVFIGMAVLYLTIKIIGVVATRRSRPDDKA
jgi:Na+-transporting methylmalonyl-CoA/oxaloacetate decarboxylase gamma subunit